MSKYNAKKVEYKGHAFDSAVECEYYQYLENKINGATYNRIELQPRYELIPKTKKQRKTEYIADFALYLDDELIEVVEKTEDNVNSPSHYNYGDIEVIDYIEQVTAHYPSNLTYDIGNAIKYLSRATHKNGKEDIAKARWYVQRVFEKWEG
ncbi:DUF1064 domain-containing protein [Staphylococcus sp. HMSC063A07]|uniref:DUF1064 domain-containing protein n=1 Tax=Staphylococcus sp. HMSC063A07 TaxID=1715076 RepID=UPI0009F51A8B|nr:DUF1064 domain-containing protein [Staphylococcus sp. HMSC063A07]